MGKQRIIAETGAGQHGVATATVCAHARPRVRRLHGRGGHRAARRSTSSACSCSAPRCVPVDVGQRTLKDAINEAMRDWVTNVDDDATTCSARSLGPHPYPTMVRDFQSVIGNEARAQMLEQAGRLPDAVVACVGGGCNAIGIFHPLPRRPGRAADRRRGGRRAAPACHARSARPAAASACCTARARTCCRTRTGRCDRAHSISAGLDYPGVGPGARVPQGRGRGPSTWSVTDAEALEAFQPPVPRGGHHPGPRDRARPGPRRARGAASSAPTASSSSTSRGAATRTSTPSRR